MFITCKCLNISINTKSTNVQTVDVSNLGLSTIELSDSFFQDICTVELGSISKEQSSLVRVRNVENWIIHRCLNCSINTHAIHREKGAAFVLINQSLLTNPTDVAALKSSDRYSVAFRILIGDLENELSSTQSPTKFSVLQVPGPVQSAMTALQQQLGEAIQQEAAKTEDRVRAYSEQQYAALEEFRERAHRDHRILARLLCETQDNLSPGFDNQNNSPPCLPVADVTSNEEKLPMSPSDIHSPNVATSKTDRRVPSTRGNNANSLDTEGLFDLEGMEENRTESFHSEEETDTDDSGSHDEGIHIPRGRGAHPNMAKSLPVNVPAFLPPNRRNREDERLPQDPMDIAASIKALAKSIHGDANVFGDLPRPRFSTQI